MPTSFGSRAVMCLRVLIICLLMYGPKGWRLFVCRLLEKRNLSTAVLHVLHSKGLPAVEALLCRHVARKMSAAAGWEWLPLALAFSYYYYAFEIFDHVDLSDDLFLANKELTASVFKTPLVANSEQHDAAVRFLLDVFRRLDRRWNSILDSGDRARLAEAVATNFRFIPILFTQENLRPIATMAGRCVDYYLEMQGCKLDYEWGLRDEGECIRVGVLVQNLLPRTETYISLAFTAGLDRKKFEAVLITLNAPDRGSFAQCVQDHCAKMVVVDAPDLHGRVARIRSLDLDILIMGNTIAGQSSELLMLLAHRMAPIQVVPTAVWPQTTGLKRTDYVLTSAITEPPGKIQDHYREKVCLMEGMFNCFVMGDRDPRRSGESGPEAKVQLPKQPVSFASGGSMYKLTPELRSVWAEILARVPESELLIYPFNHNWGSGRPSPQMLSCLTREFEEAGVSRDRVVILPHLNPEQIIELLKHVTVYLDTFPYSGAASYMEPLAALCPAVTLRGETQRGLQGAAMMEAMGLAELIAETPEHYVELAVSVALDQERRKRMVRRMMAMKPSVAFLDVNSFGERVGRGLEAMVAEVRSNRHTTKIEEAMVR